MRGTWACYLAVVFGCVPRAAGAELVEKATAAAMPWDRKVGFVVSCARDAASGRVWVGTEIAGAWCFDGKAWTQYTTKDGLGDDTVYALAVDLQGRVWAGHVNHGVSVFDGKTWRNYDVLSGGPLGSRVFAIEVCPSGPRAGEVWIASDGGLTRYWPKDDSWSFVTRADGLPADQVQCLAFDADGRVFAGTQCDGLTIASPADDYADWTNVDGPTRPGTEAEGEGLPSCMINDVLVAREGAIYVATPWGLGKSADGGKTFTYRRGADWVAKVKQRTGGAPAEFKADDATPVLAEDYVTCLAEDAVGLLWLGYRTMGYEAIDEANLSSKHAAGIGPGAGKPGEFVTCILPMFGAGPLMGTYGSGVVQAEKYFSGEGELRAPPAVAREVGKHPGPAKAPRPRAVEKMTARLAAAVKPGGPALTAAFMGDDWATQGDGIGRYGRQQYIFPSYGPGGWAMGYQASVLIGPHQNPNKVGAYNFYAELDSQSRRVLWIPNNHKRNQGEWNDGSLDRNAYGDAWEGPDLWVDVTVPAGVHRMSMYFINWDAQGGATNRRRDFLVEVKAKGKSRQEEDFAPALARARVAQFYHGVYKQFLLAGPAQYAVKIGRNYSVAAKVSGIFFDRLEGPKPAHEPSGVPIMGERQVKPPDVPADAGTGANAGVRAAEEIIATLDQGWSRDGLAALQRPYRVMAIRLAAEQGAHEAVLANWRFALPLMTASDHADFIKTTLLSREQMWEQHPQTVDTAFRATMAEHWKKLQKPIAAGTAPDAATLLNPKPNPADPEAIKGVLAPYLLLRGGGRIDTRSLSSNDERPNDFFGEFKRAEKDRKAVYRLVGEYLLYSEALAGRSSAKPKRQALAAALAATRAALELLDDTWLAARIAEAMLAPQLANAPDADGVIGRKAVLAAIVAAHADDPEGLKGVLAKLIESAGSAGEAAELRKEIEPKP